MRRSSAAQTTLVFVNTRAQAELVFQALWRLNDDNLPIALHHGCLAPEQRRKVEAAMARGELRAVVATSSLDLGIDWGDVDLVIQVGAPKGASRLMQRIGRANHRLDEPSRALLVPANRFEVLECRAALEAVARRASSTASRRGRAGSTCWRSTSLGMACAAPFDRDALYAEVRAPRPIAICRARISTPCSTSSRPAATRCGLRALAPAVREAEDGRWRIANPTVARRYRMNVGTIVEAPMLKVRLRPRAACWARSRSISSRGWSPGDTFLFAGRAAALRRHARDWRPMVSPRQGRRRAQGAGL